MAKKKKKNAPEQNGAFYAPDPRSGPTHSMVGQNTDNSTSSGTNPNDMINSIAQQLFYLIGKNKTSPLDDNDRNKAIELLTLLHQSNTLNKKEYNSLQRAIIVPVKKKTSRRRNKRH